MISKTTANNVEDMGSVKNPPSTDNKAHDIPTELCALGEDFTEYEVVAKSFISTCSPEMDERVLKAATGIISRARCPDVRMQGDKDASLQKGPEPPAQNPNNPEQWHHRYSVSLKVLAKADPKDYLNDFFSKNILQLGDAAVRIAYVEATKLTN